MARFFSIVTAMATALPTMLLLSSCSYVRPTTDTSTTISSDCITFIRKAQWSAIAQTNEMDAMRQRWESLLKAIHTDAHLPEYDYDTISTWQDLADLYSLDDESDRMVFVLLGAQLGWRYDQTPLIRNILNGYAPQKGHLLSLFKDISEESWYHYVEEWPRKEMASLAINNKTASSLERATWDICTERCDVITAITQRIDGNTNLHMSVTNVDQHAWITLFESQKPCNTEEDRMITVNGRPVSAHFYCPHPNTIAADFPDDAARRRLIEAINSGNPISLGHIDAHSPVSIPNRGGAFILSSLDINTEK